MKNKRFTPILGIVIGIIFGFFFEFQIWSLIKNSPVEIINLSMKPSGGISFGPGIITILAATLGGSIGVLIQENRKLK